MQVSLCFAAVQPVCSCEQTLVPPSPALAAAANRRRWPQIKKFADALSAALCSPTFKALSQKSSAVPLLLALVAEMPHTMHRKTEDADDQVSQTL